MYRYGPVTKSKLFLYTRVIRRPTRPGAGGPGCGEASTLQRRPHGESGRGNGINAVRLRLPGSLATPTGDDEDDLKHVSMIRVPCRDALAVKKLLLAELPPYKLHVEL